MPKTAKKPSYLLHKPTGQARVRISGKDHYLGEYGSPESRERYDKLISEWFRKNDVKQATIRVDDLALLYLNHVDQFYRHPDGEPTTEPACIRHAVKFAVETHGRKLASDFGPLALKALRERMISAGLSRTTINKAVHRLRRMFAWGVENEIVPASVHDALRCVTSLKRGRSAAREPKPITAVPDGDVESTLPKLTSVLQAMVRLQLLTGARPGEICSLRPCDLTYGTDGTWTFRPERHKTQHHGKERRIFIGPQGQDVLRPFLDRPADQHCFRPVDSEAERNEERKANRKSPMTPSHRSRRAKANPVKSAGEKYTKDAYCRVIGRACKLAGVDSWSPNQLRHSRATLLRKLFGIEAARLVLGHSDAGVTLVYAEKDFDAAAKIMQEIG